MDKVKEIKCVVWDLDNTIWDGILTESDYLTLKPGIIEIIKAIDAKGILQSISSKNNFDDAILKLKEFGIDEYFLYPEINWNAKSLSISRIRENLNIGIDTFMFCDDQPFEREEVASVHPEVFCYDAIDYKNLLKEPRLNPKFITEDSGRRRQMYLDDVKRKKEEESFEGPSEMFLASLNMKFKISEAQEEDLKRAEELTIRTNQLNATGRTYDFEELNFFRQSKDYKLLICELSDKYGSYGKIGLSLIEISDESYHIKLLLMSCRVVSRGVGTVLLSHIMQEAKQRGKRLLADFKRTDRNKMMYVGYKFANFKELSEDNEGNIVFENDLSLIQKFPHYIDIEVPVIYRETEKV
jgi:FkbH-like protein